MTRFLSAPTVINLELTDLCNERCRHCYNFWREEDSRSQSLTKDKFNQLVDMFVEAGVFHVVLSGGEPMLCFELLEHSFRRLLDNNISISCNSNLAIATEDRMKRLADAGLDHVLTSLCSHDENTNDFMVNRPGAFQKIVSGIKHTVNSGIRVSVNMIVSQKNKDHVYETGKLVHELGCQKLFGTRTVPSVNLSKVSETEFELTKSDALNVLDQLVAVKNDTGIMIGTLVSYPLCLLGNLEKYQDFVGRGCPGQSGHLLALNCNGDAHACVHESKSYGNVFNDGIGHVFKTMQDWHNGSYMYPGCTQCDYLSICKSGCRMAAHGYFGSMTDADPLMVNNPKFIKPHTIVYDPAIYAAISQGLQFTVPKRLRFRKENGFWLVNIRWANTITVENDVGLLLKKHQEQGTSFGIKEVGTKNEELLARLFFKDAVSSDSFAYQDTRNKDKAGFGPDI